MSGAPLMASAPLMSCVPLMSCAPLMSCVPLMSGAPLTDHLIVPSVPDARPPACILKISQLSYINVLAIGYLRQGKWTV
jgi:hypothetical protein